MLTIFAEASGLDAITSHEYFPHALGLLVIVGILAYINRDWLRAKLAEGGAVIQAAKPKGEVALVPVDGLESLTAKIGDALAHADAQLKAWDIPAATRAEIYTKAVTDKIAELHAE